MFAAVCYSRAVDLCYAASFYICTPFSHKAMLGSSLLL